jgi:hypothetical protein
MRSHQPPPAARRPKASPPAGPAFALLCACLVSCATALPDPASPGAVDLYRRELAREPTGRRGREVRDGLERAAFAEARKQHTVLSLRSYLSEFPTGSRAREASALLESLRWDAALQANTLQAYEGYAADEPEGPHLAQAFARLRRLRLEAAIGSRDASALRALLAQPQPAPEAAPKTDDKAQAEGGKPADLHDDKWGALEDAKPKDALAALGDRSNAQVNDELGHALDDAASATKERARLAAAEAKAQALLEELDFGAAAAAPLPVRAAQLQAFLRRFPTSPRRPDTLGHIEQLAVADAVLREDEGQLRALWRGSEPKGRQAAGEALLARASAALDAQALQELAQGAEPVAGQAKLLLKLLEARPAAERARLVAAAKALLLPAQVPAQLAQGLPDRARSIASAAVALDGERLAGLLAELGALHPLTQLAALDAVQALLRGLPELERQVRAARLLATGESLAQDGARLAGLSLLAEAAGDGKRALQLARAAAGRDARSLPALLLAAALESGPGGEPALAPAAVAAAAGAIAALVDQHDPALAPVASPGMPAGEREPSVWGLCAAARAAALVNGLGAAGPLLQRSAAILANARRALAEAEKLSRKPGACDAVLHARETEESERAKQRAQSAQVLRKAGALGTAALQRAFQRDPAPAVHAAAAP